MEEREEEEKEEEEEEHEEIHNKARDLEDPLTVTEKERSEDSFSILHKSVKKLHSSFLWTSCLTILLPVLFFILTTAMVDGSDGLSVWWVRLLGSDNFGDASGRGITIVLGFGWTFGLFLVYIYQGNLILRTKSKGGSNRTWFCCLKKKKKMKNQPPSVDEQKIGVLIGSLYTFSNFCTVLFLSVAWPVLEQRNIFVETMTIPFAYALWSIWGFTFAFLFSRSNIMKKDFSPESSSGIVKIYKV